MSERTTINSDKPSFPSESPPPPKVGFFKYIYNELQRIGVLPKSYEKVSKKITDVAQTKKPPDIPPPHSIDRPVIHLQRTEDAKGDQFMGDLSLIKTRKHWLLQLQAQIKEAVAQKKINVPKLQQLLKEYEAQEKEINRKLNVITVQLEALADYTKESTALDARMALLHARVEEFATLETEIWEVETIFQIEKGLLRERIDKVLQRDVEISDRAYNYVKQMKPVMLNEEDKKAHKDATLARLYKKLDDIKKGVVQPERPKALPHIPIKSAQDKPNRDIPVSPMPNITVPPMAPSLPKESSKASTFNRFTSFVEEIVESVASTVKDITNILASRKNPPEKTINEFESIKEDLKNIKEAADNIETENDYLRLCDNDLRLFQEKYTLESLIANAEEEGKKVIGKIPPEVRSNIPKIFYQSKYQGDEDLAIRKNHLIKLAADLEGVLTPYDPTAHTIDLEETYLSSEIIPEEPKIPPIKIKRKEVQLAPKLKKATSKGEFRAWEDQKKLHAKELLSDDIINNKNETLNFLLDPKNRELLEAYIEYVEIEKTERVGTLALLADLEQLRYNKDDPQAPTKQDLFVEKYQELAPKIDNPEKLKIIENAFSDFLIDDIDAKEMLNVLKKQLIDDKYQNEFLNSNESYLKEFIAWANS